MQAELPGGLGVHHYFVGSLRVGQTPVDERDPVLLGEITVGRAFEDRRLLAGFRVRVEVAQENDVGVEPQIGFSLLHVREVGDGAGTGGVVTGVVADVRIEKASNA